MKVCKFVCLLLLYAERRNKYYEFVRLNLTPWINTIAPPGVDKAEARVNYNLN